MRLLVIIYLIVPILICSCSETDKNKGDDPNDESKKNGEYYWWVGDDGVGKWIKKSEDGTWEPTDGTLTDYRKNGLVSIVTPYKDGNINGVCKFYDQYGDIYADVAIHNGIADSSTNIYYPDSIIQMYLQLEYLENDIMAGIITINYPSGKPFIKEKIYTESRVYDYVNMYYDNGNDMYSYRDDTIIVYSKDGIATDTLLDGQEILYNSAIVPLHMDPFSVIDLRHLAEMEPLNRPDIKLGCISGDCMNGQGTYVYPNGTRVAGGFRNSMPSGKCKSSDAQSDSIYFEGNTKNGILEGKCIVYGEEELTEGQFKDGLLDGKGSISYYSGAKLVSKYTKNFPSDSMAYMRYDDGTVVRGIINQEYEFNGPASVVFPDGDSVSCMLKHSDIRGNATYYYKSGKIEKRHYASDGYTIIEE